VAVVMPVVVVVIVVAVLCGFVGCNLHRIAQETPPSMRWWAGWPPRACSAWKMASATS
jgi:hypothetical protein